MLHAREHEHAAAAFHRVLALTPRLPEAHVNMGFAMLGQFRHGLARDFFESAIALRPSQRNAYYGLAAAFEGLGDLRGAVGAMRTYVHLSPPDDPYLRKANAALWEWNTALASAQASRSRS
jgi:tetratricopeptide (TPR) repeat protein